ncbi:hypothetical protein [Laspinema olomoucense]|nr:MULTISPECIES: hypothetical protein [unclassified Laspinema]
MGQFVSSDRPKPSTQVREAKSPDAARLGRKERGWCLPSHAFG